MPLETVSFQGSHTPGENQSLMGHIIQENKRPKSILCDPLLTFIRKPVGFKITFGSSTNSFNLFQQTLMAWDDPIRKITFSFLCDSNIIPMNMSSKKHSLKFSLLCNLWSFFLSKQSIIFPTHVHN